MFSQVTYGFVGRVLSGGLLVYALADFILLFMSWSVVHSSASARVEYCVCLWTKQWLQVSLVTALLLELGCL